MAFYRDLIVWQKSMDLVTRVYQLTKSFPKEETYGLSAQIRRSAISIPCNIAEGYGRNAARDMIRFLHISMGPLLELQTQLEIARNLAYLTTEIFNDYFESTREIESMLTGLIRSKVP